jgi:hypothetical protein
MSDRTSGGSRDPRRPARPDAWWERPGSTVFEPGPPPEPHPWEPPPPAAPARPSRPPSGWSAEPEPAVPDPGRTRTRPGPRRPPGREPGRADPGPPPGPGVRSPVGLGALLGVGGAAAFLAALLVLPWFSAGGEGVTLADIGAAFTVPETDPSDVVPGAGEGAGSTLPDGIPTPGEVTDAAEQQARDAAGEAAAGAIDSGKSRYLELYSGTLWVVSAAAVSLAAVLSTLLAPRSAALSLLLGVRRLAGLVVVLAGLAHGAALWIVFTGDGAPSPAIGVWLGVGGLVAVLLGCVLGPRR